MRPNNGMNPIVSLSGHSGLCRALGTDERESA